VTNAASGQPEAGVWVLAETNLPTPYRKIVVTDDQGRFLVPDLPAASYEVWVRGFGLKDSARVQAERGQQVRLQAADATPQEAARIYPASSWAALIQPPSRDQLPPEFKGSQDHWLTELRACNQCHQLGMTATRLYNQPEQWNKLLSLNRGMSSAADELGRPLLTKTLADWVGRMRAGALPPAPPRPAGIERNFVVTQWDWGSAQSFVHDNVATDKRNPTLYPYGKVFGADRMYGGRLLVLDPVKHTVEALQVEPRSKDGYDANKDYYHTIEGDAERWMASPHNPMMDDQGRVWMTAGMRAGGAENNPRWIKETIVTESMSPEEIAIAYQSMASRGNGMHLGFYDSKTGRFGQVDTSFPTHHLQFDWQGRLWTDAGIIGTLDLNKLDFKNIPATEAKAQTAWMRVDPRTKRVLPSGGYGITISPVDGNVFISVSTSNGSENKIWKIDPKTRKMTDYPLPAPGRLAHGIDHSTDGRVWFSAGSGHLARFDPKAERFTYWELPGPKYPGTGKETGSTEYPYFLWVDQFDTLGLGKDMVIVTGTSSDALFIFDPKTERFSTFRMPYPLPFFTRGLDGRIDDARAGWKGRGLWASYNSYLPKYSETRMGYVAHIQLRPNPLAN
jgi:streptogramin lyase